MSSSPINFLPYGRQSIDDEDIKAVVEVLKSEWLTTGPKVDEFEAALANYLKVKEVVVCSSGSSALHLAALGLRIGPGDAVIVPAQTFLATANACRYVGAEVIFSDVDPETGLITPDNLKDALNCRTFDCQIRAIFVVHLGGHCVDLDSIAAIAYEEGIPIIEDACHALGAEIGESRIGNCQLSKMAIFSFHPVKTICMGEGGAVTLNDTLIAERLRSLRSHGITRNGPEFQNLKNAFDESGDPNLWYYEMSELGFNFRATDIQCALGLNQLSRLDLFLSKRRILMEKYCQSLAPLAPLVRLRKEATGVKSAYHLAVVHIDFLQLGLSRTKVMAELRDEGISSQVHYIPVHMQPYYSQRYGHISLPGAEKYYANCLSLPLYPDMMLKDVERVVDSLSKVLGLAR